MWQQPAVLIGLVAAIVGLIVKAVRLQTKVDGQEDDIKGLTAVVAEQKGVLTAHKENSDIHFNLRMSQQVDEKNEFRFRTIEGQLGEINHKLDRLTERK